MQVFNCFKRSLSSLIVIGFLLSFLFISPLPTFAGKKPEEVVIPENLHNEIEYLLNFSTSEGSQSFSQEKISGLIGFVSGEKKESVIYTGKEKDGATSAYYEFDINKDFQSFIEYSYSPDIPDCVFVPSSLKFSTWSDRKGNVQPFPNMAALLVGLSEPVVIKGVSHVENTPDPNSGAYYGYDSNQTYILLNNGGRRVLVSITSQTNISDVGKKGYPVLKKDGGHYFYSGKKGLTKCGLGWVSSYIYDSFSVSLYLESKDGKIIRNGLFKWMNAGWKNMNMVKSTHIYNGLERYANGLKAIIESPDLPEPEKLSKTFIALNSLSVNELREKVASCFSLLNQTWKQEGIKLRTKIAKKYLSQEYISAMTRDELFAILSKEYMKSVLGEKNSMQLNSPVWIIDSHKGGLSVN